MSSRNYAIGIVMVVAVLVPRTLVADWKDDIDFTKLAAAVGGSLEDGTGIVVSQVEANECDPNLNEYCYQPLPTNPQYTGKTFIDESGLTTAFSSHAGLVARHHFGNTASIAPGVTEIHSYEAVDWLENALNIGADVDGDGNAGSGQTPVSQPWKVQNHSWIGNGLSAAEATELLQRLDYVVQEDDIFVSVGAGNNPGPNQLLMQSYNTITVGRTSGSHGNGPTTIYGAGRIKPEIVAPESNTSRTTAIVSSAATMLHEVANNQASPDAPRSVVIKSVLMAGATKKEFPGWSRTTTQPLDTEFGAGELNIYNSYFIMTGGEQDGTVGELPSPVADKGWDFGESIVDPLNYNIEVPTGKHINEMSVVLTWNIQVTDIDPTDNFIPSTSLADMSLRVYDSTNLFQDVLLDSSLSTVDNVEHIYLTSLGAGTYTIEVSSDSDVPYGLAWRAMVVPEPGTFTLLSAIGGVALVFVRRRRRRGGNTHLA